MRVLFVHEVNYSSKVIYEMHEFPELLALRGHEVSFFHYAELPLRPRVSFRAVRETVAGRAYPSARINLITPPTFGGQPTERYVAPLLSLPSLRWEIRHGGYDVVVLYAVPTTGWQVVLLAKRAGVPVVFRALDVSHQIRKNLLSPVIRAIEGFIYRNVSLISANNPAMARYCTELAGNSPRAVVNLPPVDLSHFEVAFGGSKRADLGFAEDDRVIVYMGTFFSFSGLDVFLRSMVGQFRRDPLLRVLLLGGGEMDAELRQLSVELGITDRVTFTGMIPYSSLPEYLKVANVAINPFVPQLLTNVAFPHKVLQYMATGVPVVSTSLEGLHGVLGDDAGITWVKSPDEVAAAASHLAASGVDNLNRISGLQLSAVKSQFSKEASVVDFESALKEAELR